MHFRVDQIYFIINEKGAFSVNFKGMRIFIYFIFIFFKYTLEFTEFYPKYSCAFKQNHIINILVCYIYPFLNLSNNPYNVYAFQ